MPAADATLVYLVIDGFIYDFWTEYTCSSSLFEADSPFAFSAPVIGNAEIAEMLGNRLSPGKVVQVFVRAPTTRPMAALQYTGITKTVELTVDRERGANLHIAGRNHLAPIVDCDVMPGFSPENLTFADLIKRVLIDPAPGRTFGFYKADQVVINNDAGRALLTGNPKAGVAISSFAPPELETLKIDQAKPHAGETIFHYLQRHATRFGLMIWGTADGKVVFSRPNYEQKPLYNLTLRRGEAASNDNNVKQWSSRLSFENRFSECHVYGHSHGGDSMRSTIHAVVHDEQLERAGLYRPTTVHDNNAKTIAQADQRGRMELGKRLHNADTIRAVVQGHSSENAVWAIDTMVSVTCDDYGLVNDPRYVVSRTFTRSREHGTDTHLQVMPKNSIPLGEVQYIAAKSKGGLGTSPATKPTPKLTPVQQAIADLAAGTSASENGAPVVSKIQVDVMDSISDLSGASAVLNKK